MRHVPRLMGKEQLNILYPKCLGPEVFSIYIMRYLGDETYMIAMALVQQANGKSLELL